MPEVLPSPPPSSDATTTTATSPPRPRSPPQRRDRTPPPPQDKPASSRPQSMSFPAFHSSLPYALVRDFAYPPFHPMHYGTPPDPPSGTTTPGSESWNGNASTSRRLSDPSESFGAWRGSWKDGGEEGVGLPSTSFGSGEDGEGTGRKHRRSRSYNNVSPWERERRRSSGTQRRSRTSGSGSGSEDMFHFTSSSQSQSLDPAGSESLRHSRAGNSRRDSHFAATLPSRTFHHSTSTSTPQPRPRRSRGEDEDLIPLDAEASTHAHSPQRASMGPEDELFAGESLALYAFEPENANELRLREGQIILVSYRHGQGWLVAEDMESGEQGLVPEEYVRLVREIEGWDVERGGFVEGDEEGDGGEEGGEDESMQDATSDVSGSRRDLPGSSDADLETENPRHLDLHDSQRPDADPAGDRGQEDVMLTDSPPEIEGLDSDSDPSKSPTANFSQQQQQKEILKGTAGAGVGVGGESRQDSAHAYR